VIRRLSGLFFIVDVDHLVGLYVHEYLWSGSAGQLYDVGPRLGAVSIRCRLARSLRELPAAPRVEAGHQRVGVELRKRDVEDQMSSSIVYKEENQVDDRADSRDGTSLDSQPNDSVDDIICSGKASLASLQVGGKCDGDCDI